MLRLMTLAALAALTAAAAPARAELPTLIPRNVLFGNPVKAAPRISPDGKRLAYLAPDKKNVLQVWVQTLGKDDAKQVTNDKKRGIRSHFWTYAPDTLSTCRTRTATRTTTSIPSTSRTTRSRDLTPLRRASAAMPVGHQPGPPRRDARQHEQAEQARSSTSTGSTSRPAR